MSLISKIILFPIAVIYGGIIILRNWLYKTQFIGSTDFEIPVISIGNLSMGGTGKTPMVEFLIEQLYGKYKVGVLSRGYKRKTTGYLEVLPNLDANKVGDEPFMLKLKYPDTKVAVGEQRVIAIPKLLAKHPETQVILLDDAFQHQSVRPDMNILLTTYEHPFYKDAIFPLGTLREFASGKSRANIIVVTKCPPHINEVTQKEIMDKINPTPKQLVFFSTLDYGAPYNILNPMDRMYFQGDKTSLLITGIANASPLKEYLLNQVKEVVHFEYDDHHFFSTYELEIILKNYPNNKQWITTEKDGVRLALHRNWLLQQGVSLYCIPIRTRIIGKNAQDFSATVIGFLDYFYRENIEATAENINQLQ